MLNKLKERMEKARDVAQEAATNLLSRKVSIEVQEYRYNTCSGCEKLYKPTDTCRVCGCFMKVKTWMPEQECPIKKWTKAPAADSSN